jgi:hypothetical protein
MSKCHNCGRNLYAIKMHAGLDKIGTPLNDIFSEPTEPIGDILDKYNLADCCRIELLSYIPDIELSKLLG